MSDLGPAGGGVEQKSTTKAEASGPEMFTDISGNPSSDFVTSRCEYSLWYQITARLFKGRQRVFNTHVDVKITTVSSRLIKRR